MTTATRNRYHFEADRAWDFLGKLPTGHPLWEPTLGKVYRLAAQADGVPETEATAYADALIARWRIDAARMPLE